jgi:hypothetical protein
MSAITCGFSIGVRQSKNCPKNEKVFFKSIARGERER